MLPYTGTNILYIALCVVGVLISIAFLLYARSIEKSEKMLSGEDSKSKRNKKYLVFSGFAIFLIISVALGLFASSISHKQYNSALKNDIESNNVKITSGLVDPKIPVTENSIAKFTAQSETGIIRCRVVAKGKTDKLKYLCLNAEEEFAIPLESFSS